MPPKPETPRRVTPPPALGVRLAWWFGIYFIFKVPVILAWDTFSLSMLLPLGMFPNNVFIWSLILCYLLNFYAVLKAPARRRFDLLLFILIALAVVDGLRLSNPARMNGNPVYIQGNTVFEKAAFWIRWEIKNFH